MLPTHGPIKNTGALGDEYDCQFRTALHLLTQVEAIEFSREMGRGKTEPLILVCERADGTTVEVVAKLVVGCDAQHTSLAREAIAACLAADLGLPVPEAFVVQITDDFVESVPSTKHKDRLHRSRPYAFGSRLVTGQWSNWNDGAVIPSALVQLAASIFCFDAITQNPDRRAENTNCLTKDDDVRIFDHELAFTHGMVLFWKAPWEMGGLKSLETPGAHIFRQGLVGRDIDYGPIKSSWGTLSDAHIQSYLDALPDEWRVSPNAIESALRLIRDARDNIDGCITEVQRVLA